MGAEVEPTTGYALLDDERIAYQIIGEGPVDLVVAPSWFSAFDIEWEEPSIRLFFERLGSFARVIRLDRRGSGASDPVRLDDLPPWEAFSEDIACVMTAVGSESAFWGLCRDPCHDVAFVGLRSNPMRFLDLLGE